MIKMSGSPVCLVAQIVGFSFDDSARSLGSCSLSVEPLGRINDILELYRGDEVIKDEVRAYYLISYSPFNA